MYLMLGTRPDIAHAVGKLARFSSNPSDSHWDALKHLLNYIAHTSDLTLVYFQVNGETAVEPTAFVDADFAHDKDNSHSMSGYSFHLGEAAFSWYSKKNTHVSHSTADAEYTAAFHRSQNAFWLHQFYEQISLPLESPITIRCDSQSAIAIAVLEETHLKSKPIRVEYHSIHERIQRHKISIEYVNTKDNCADIFTKSLPISLFQTHRDFLGLTSYSEILSSQVDTSLISQYTDAPEN